MSQQYPPTSAAVSTQYSAVSAARAERRRRRIDCQHLGHYCFLPLIGSIVGIIAGNSAKTTSAIATPVTGVEVAQAAVVIGWIDFSCGVGLLRRGVDVTVLA
jgi:hypothetical protein